MADTSIIEYRLRLSVRERRVIINALAVQIENYNRHRGAMEDIEPLELQRVLALVAACEPYPFELAHCSYRNDCPHVKNFGG